MVKELGPVPSVHATIAAPSLWTQGQMIDAGLLYFTLLYFGFIFWPHSGHMEVPRPGIKSEPQLRPEPQLQQHQILNPLAPSQGLNPHHFRDNARSLTLCTTAGTQGLSILSYSENLIHPSFSGWEGY